MASKKKIHLVDFYLLFAFCLIADIFEAISGLLFVFLTPFVGAILGTGVGAMILAAGSAAGWLIAKLVGILGLHGLSSFLKVIVATPWLTIAAWALGPVVSWFFSKVVDLAVGFYLYIKGAKILLYIASSIVEMLPIVSWLPIRTISIVIVYFISKAEENIEEISPAAGKVAETAIKAGEVL